MCPVPGYIKVRCVDDPSVFSKSVTPTQPSSIIEEEDELDAVEELPVKHNIHDDI